MEESGEMSAPEEAEVVERLLRLAGPREGATPEAALRVRQAVHARWLEVVRARRRSRLMLRVPGSLAAAALLVAAVATFLRPEAPPPPAELETPATMILSVGMVRDRNGSSLAPGDRLAAGSIVATDPDSRAAIRLPGGQIARLDTDTRVVLNGGAEVTLEQGAIYVDTHPEGATGGPVVIRTAAGLIREIGTRFEVRLTDGSLRVRVRDGSVHLQRAGRTHAVEGGAELSLDPDGEPRIGSTPTHGPDWEWVLAASPGFELEGRTLGEFLGWISSETGLTVVYSPEVEARDASGIVLHGSVAGMRPDRSPSAVLPACGLAHEIDGGVLTIRRAAAGTAYPTQPPPVESPRDSH